MGYRKCVEAYGVSIWRKGRNNPKYYIFNSNSYVLNIRITELANNVLQNEFQLVLQPRQKEPVLFQKNHYILEFENRKMHFDNQEWSKESFSFGDFVLGIWEIFD